MFLHIAHKNPTWFDFLGNYIDDYFRLYPTPGLMDHIYSINPDVVFIQSAVNYSENFVGSLKDMGIKVIGHHNIELHNIDKYKLYDVMFTGSESIRKEFEDNNINSKILSHAFAPEMNNGLKELPIISNLLCSGSLILKDNFHYTRLKYVNDMMEAGVPIWLRMHIETNKPVELVKRALCGQVIYRRYPREMKRINTKPLMGKWYWQDIKSHPVVFNCHADFQTEASNMRMFEVCGIGSLLLTDHFDNIRDHFEPGKEILTYRDSDELISKARWALNNHHEARKIAERGRARVMRDHLIEHRVKTLIS